MYWIDDKNVVKAPIAGGPATTLASGNDVNNPRGGIAVDVTGVYWTNYAQATNGSVMKVPIAGGVPMTLASKLDNPIGIAVDESNVYWVNSGSMGGAAAVLRVPLNGGTPTTLMSSRLAYYWAIAVQDANNGYWTDSGYQNGTVMQMPK